MTQENDLLPFDMVSLLDSDEMISEYLNQVLAEGDTQELIDALNYIAQAKSKNTMPCQTLLPNTKPNLTQLLEILKTLGIRLRAETI